MFYVSMIFDSEALPILKRIVNAGGNFISVGGGGKTPYRFIDKHAFHAIRQTYSQIDRVSKFNIQVHENLCEALLLTKNVQGDFVEVGVYKGSSSLTAINYEEALISNEGKNRIEIFFAGYL